MVSETRKGFEMKWLEKVINLKTDKLNTEKDQKEPGNVLSVTSPWWILCGISMASLCATIAMYLKTKKTKTTGEILPQLSQNKELTLGDYLHLEQIVQDLGNLSSDSLLEVINTADRDNYDRKEALRYYILILSGIYEQVDLDTIDPIEEETLMN